MPLVNPTLPNDGEAADAADISVPFLALLAVFNGHIGADNLEPGILNSTNLAPNSVTTVKIIDGAVTNAKLATAAGELGGVYAAHVPTFTNFTLNNGTINYCKYTKIGKTIHYKGRVTIGAGTVFSGIVHISLPVNSSADYVADDVLDGTAMIYDTGSSNRPGIPVFVTNAKMTIVTIATFGGTNPVFTDITTATRAIQTAGPITWSAGDVIQWHVTYECV